MSSVAKGYKIELSGNTVARPERTIPEGRARFSSRKESIQSRLSLRILISTEQIERRGSSVGIVTRLRAGRSGARNLLFTETVHTGSGAHTTFYSMGAIVLSRGKAA